MFHHVMHEDNDSEDASETECRLCMYCCIDLYRQLEDGGLMSGDE